jgi:hypothetical protein
MLNALDRPYKVDVANCHPIAYAMTGHSLTTEPLYTDGQWHKLLILYILNIYLM